MPLATPPLPKNLFFPKNPENHFYYYVGHSYAQLVWPVRKKAILGNFPPFFPPWGVNGGEI